MIDGVQAYWSWDFSDYSKPLQKSQVDQQHRPGHVPPTAVDVTSQQALESMKQRALGAQAAAIQNAISLSNGEGLQYEWDEDSSTVFRTDPYEGSPKVHANDGRKRPLLWSNRHCRIYNDPMCGSFERFNSAYFEVFHFEFGVPHPEFDDFLHMGSIPGDKEADAIRRNGMRNGCRRSYKEGQALRRPDDP